jgi:hypothetical protein
VVLSRKSRAVTWRDRRGRLTVGFWSSVSVAVGKSWFWVAGGEACCLTHNISRATLNLKDYEDFASITSCAYWGWPSCGRSLLG